MQRDWKPARVDGFGVFVAIGGGSTTGKTFTMLRMATGIKKARAAEFANDKRPLAGQILVADTEGGRTHHYADRFDFRVHDMQPPFDPMAFADLAVDAEKQGAACLGIDNFSLEWVGEGGVLDAQEQELAAKVAADRRNLSEVQKRFRHTRASWIAPKRPHNKMMGILLQRRMPIIFCIRASLQEQLQADSGEEDEPGKKAEKRPPVWKPQQDPRFIYEWTVSWTLHPDTPGMPRRDLRGPIGPAFKCEPQHAHIFPDGQHIGEQAGEQLWRWATSGAAAKSAPDPAGDARGSASAGGGDANTGASPSAPTDDDTFPGDKPSKHDSDAKRDATEAAAAKAKSAADDLVAEIAATKPEHVQGLLDHRSNKGRIARLAEAYPAQHGRIMDAAAERMASK